MPDLILDVTSGLVKNLSLPATGSDAANKTYVDTELSAVVGSELAYIKINSTGTSASATSTDGIAIGEGAIANGPTNSVAIGPAVSNGASNSVKIGSSNTNYMFLGSEADLTLYDGSSSTSTSIFVTGTATNIDLTLVPKGTGIINASSKRITSVADPTAAQDAATKNYVDTTTTANPIYVAIAGDTMTGLLTLSGDPSANLHAATKQYVDTTTQPLDSDLSALAGLATTGVVVRTSTGTAATRTITGTTNRIVVTNGSGVSGDPILDIGTDVVTLTSTQVLTNKTLSDSTTFFQNQTDTTKKLQFELSSITTATTRTLTVPNASGTIALTSDTTLTYFKANSTGTAASASGTDAIAIGEGASATQTNSVAIGPAVTNTIANTVRIGSSNTNYCELSSSANLALYDGTGGTSTSVSVVGTATNINLSLVPKGAGIIETTSTIQPSADNTYNLGSPSRRWATMYGVSTSSLYADLAERYEADEELESGTVVVFGGEKEITMCKKSNDTAVAGVISTNPGFRMNDHAGSDQTHPLVALKGKVPCKIVGPIKKGDLIVTSDCPGHGTSAGKVAEPYTAFARAIEDFNGMVGVILVGII
ncbi:MAG: hypothetical protein HC836_33145 [Richelia sp. RM2_1_2]|nr:hypothetical protein [Richelia sp. RM2_1_2]